MSILSDEGFLNEFFGVTYENIKILLIYQYDIEKNNKDSVILNDDRLKGTSKTEYFHRYISAKTVQGESYDRPSYVLHNFQDTRDEILKHKKLVEEYCLLDKSVCESMLFTDGLSSYYDILLFVACMFDMHRYPSDWEKY